MFPKTSSEDMSSKKEYSLNISAISVHLKKISPLGSRKQVEQMICVSKEIERVTLPLSGQHPGCFSLILNKVPGNNHWTEGG